MNVFEMNLVAPDSPVLFTPLGSEKQYWLNPNGTVTAGGAWNGVLLPAGIIDTGTLGGLNANGDIILYKPDLAAYFDTNYTRLDPSTGLPLHSSPTKPVSELTTLDIIRASVDGYFSTLEQVINKANASLPDVGKINVNAFKEFTFFTRAGALAFADTLVSYNAEEHTGQAQLKGLK